MLRRYSLFAAGSLIGLILVAVLMPAAAIAQSISQTETRGDALSWPTAGWRGDLVGHDPRVNSTKRLDSSHLKDPIPLASIKSCLYLLNNRYVFDRFL
jgi:hypothetical protein